MPYARPTAAPPRPDASSLPPAGAPSRRNLDTQTEERQRKGEVATHFTFVDGAPQSRAGGRRPASKISKDNPSLTTHVHECLNGALQEQSSERSVAQHFTVNSVGARSERPKGGRRAYDCPSRGRSPEEQDHRPGRKAVSMETSVGRVLRGEDRPGAPLEQQMLCVERKPGNCNPNNAGGARAGGAAGAQGRTSAPRAPGLV